MKILIFGASGLLGGVLYRRLSENYRVLGTFFNSQPPAVGHYIWRDLSFFSSVKDLILKQNPDLIINCAADTDVDFCASNKRESSRINMDMPAMLAKLWDGRLIHISSPAVFQGTKSGLYTEDDKTYPVNQYGYQKRQAELHLKERAIIFRADFYDRLAGYIVSNLSAGKRIAGFKDISFSPISASNYAKIIEMVIEKELPNGIYHAGGAEGYTKHGFSVRVASGLGMDSSLIYSGKSNFDTPRPKNTRLDSRKLERELGIKMPILFEEL